MAISAAERSREIDALVRALVCNRKVFISDGSDPDRVQREIARLRERIERDQSEISRLEFRLASWQDSVDAIDMRIAELRKEQALLATDKKLEAIARAQTAIEKLLGAGYTIEELTELAAAAQGDEEIAARLTDSLLAAVATDDGDQPEDADTVDVDAEEDAELAAIVAEEPDLSDDEVAELDAEADMHADLEDEEALDDA